MKKTIAILLVLVIAGVGLFAAVTPVTLDLSTTIAPINRLAITDAATFTYEWSTDPELINTSFDVSNAFGTAVTAANLHYKTNNAGAVTLKISGSALVNNGDGAFMPYLLECGNASIQTLDATLVTSANDVFTYLQTGLETASLPITVLITEGTDLDDYTAGTYSTTVTFSFTAS